MKRVSAALVVAGVLSVAIPGGAVQAAPAPESLGSVVTAIKKQFAKKSSVRFSVRRRGGPPPSDDLSISGAYRFNAAGMYAADLTVISREPAATGRSRQITMGRYYYSQSYVRSDEGKYIWKSPPKLGKWDAWQNLAGVVWGKDLVNGINPGFLDLAASYDAATADGGTVEGVRTTLHSGTVTVLDLGERQAGISFGTEDMGSYGGQITWKLWTGPDHLPRRFHATMKFTKPEGGDAGTMTMNIVYRGWGSPVKITAPPERLIDSGW
ncbi:hypothetical protein HCN51_47320 [Nonomuraea sp. FMUSA5-5]|uniref:DUF2092 domain-containing protein n=1 Tax=Nonomuraea composti TaxID=2720023 RepID=A0ABX1BGY7_9ACTN|nr:hypothetical protein [Nonomuraea sp. FMUSA5-5]NJP96956.1 hypothetical protein [Nonomuraea sp. FMUSA5-5]